MKPNPENKRNIVLLKSSGYAPTNKDVARNLREWADAIEQDEACYGTVVIVMEIDGEVRRAVIGGPNTHATVMGILFNAATLAVGECAGWQESD